MLPAVLFMFTTPASIRTPGPVTVIVVTVGARRRVGSAASVSARARERR